MATNQILTKQSSENDIRRYFNAILELSKSDKEFPVNLEEVWMLVFSRKDHAVRELKENFMQDIDYQVFLKNGGNQLGGRPASEYFLTVPCLEFFIARKVRAVFEVYRQVFHHKLNYNACNLARQLDEANEKINRLYSILNACQTELNHTKSLIQAEKELIALRATVEAEKRIAVLEYRLSESEKRTVRTNCAETVQPEVRKISSAKPIQTELFRNEIEQPDYAWSCRMASKDEVESNYPGSMLIGEMCKRIRKEHGRYIKPGDVFVWFRKNGFLSSDKSEYNKPSAECMKNRWIIYRRQRGINQRGYIYCTPYITPKGYDYFSELILKEGGAQ